MKQRKASNKKGIECDEWDRGNPLRRCTATSSRTGKRCRKWAIRGGTVCSTHGGSCGHIRRMAKQRLELAADRMAKELLGIAVSAESEAVKLQAVRDALDRAGIPAKAEVTVELKPWEQLMGDITGIATISRAEHRARQGSPADDTPDAIDAEVVDSSSPGGPVEMGPDSPEDAMRRPDRADDPTRDMPPRSGSPSAQLMTLEDAAEANRIARAHTIR